MNMYMKGIEDLAMPLKSRTIVFRDFEKLNKFYAVDFCDELEKKQAAGEMLNVICPVGPIDYRYFAAEVNKRGLSCRNLRMINMDEYIGEDGELIPESHPLSFRRFMNQQFHDLIPEAKAVLPENRVFPDPKSPEKITELIDEIGGADIVWCGMGITGHVAFNDPPTMLGEPDNLESFRNCKTRIVTTSPMSNAQMAMGGTNGVHEIIPPTAVTIG
ncbi:MAG: glucosamine-6-phosphate isomerase, partial [Victivallaceae bacterium]|nr:glucosamine-6-phosphate isomerase [Victivallaceae bacterium]